MPELFCPPRKPASLAQAPHKLFLNIATYLPRHSYFHEPSTLALSPEVLELDGLGLIRV